MTRSTVKALSIRNALPVAAFAVALALTSCAVPGTSSSAPGAGSAIKPISVTASFYPLEFLVKELGGDYVNVTSLTPAGGEPHDLELSPAKVNEMSKADLVVYLSGFQPSVDKAVAEHAPKHVTDVAKEANLLPANTANLEGGTMPQEESHDHANGEAGHNHSTLDPHFWQDPSRMIAVAKLISQDLSKLAKQSQASDSDKKALESKLNTNLDKTVAALTKIKDDYKAGLASCQRHEIVTAHTAFAYLAGAYGLKQIGITGIDPESEPSPARLQEVAKLVKERNVSTIFFETLLDPKIATTLAGDLGIKSDVLDPIESVKDGNTYLTVMESNLNTLKKALDCK